MFLILNFNKQCSVRACWAKTFVHREQTRFGRLRTRYPPSVYFLFCNDQTETQCTHKQHCLANMYTLKPQKNRPRGTALPWQNWWPGSLAEWPTGTTVCWGGWPCALRGRVLCVTPGCWTFCKWTAKRPRFGFFLICFLIEPTAIDDLLASTFPQNLRSVIKKELIVRSSLEKEVCYFIN